MTTEERITKLERHFEKELAEIKTEIANQNQPKFKNGEFVYMTWNNCYLIGIIKELKQLSGNHVTAICHASVNTNTGLKLTYLDIFDPRHPTRLATDYEEQQLIDKLRENGKDWDYVNKQIVDYRWKPKLEECYFVPDVFSVGLVDDYCNTDTLFDRRVIEKNLAFRTPEEAVAVAKEWLQSRK